MKTAHAARPGGLGSSHTWATLGYGILNEVYWPSTGRPQIRDLGFIVAKDGQWWELNRLDQYTISTPRPYVLLPTVRHEGTDFAVTLEMACDDLRGPGGPDSGTSVGTLTPSRKPTSIRGNRPAARCRFCVRTRSS